jgi:hypothetical protein
MKLASNISGYVAKVSWDWRLKLQAGSLKWPSLVGGISEKKVVFEIVTLNNFKCGSVLKKVVFGIKYRQGVVVQKLAGLGVLAYFRLIAILCLLHFRLSISSLECLKWCTIEYELSENCGAFLSRE